MARSPARPLSADVLVDLLARHMAGGYTRAGAFAHTFQVGEHFIEVALRVRRKVPALDAQAHVAAALAHLEGLHYWPSCRGKLGGGSCSFRISTVVVRPVTWKIHATEPDITYEFACTQHSKAFEVRGDLVVLPLPRAPLELLRKELTRRQDVGQAMGNRWRQIAESIALWIAAVRGDHRPYFDAWRPYEDARAEGWRLARRA